MGSKYPVLPPDKILRALEEFGFEKVSQKGSHIKLKNPDGKVVIVPFHYEIAKGTLKSILEQAGISLEEFKKHL
ncbi:type II toxin-antitoxin system HicA family toxin [Thermoanaerobacter wiegelii]|uniref:YcfA family protein n=1 Tax=Thermoanaerobacter wiegelii Rt8.B1 TaxID=697303 RepID=G2MW98_9THEO|nr:type II toxin-antitoxin system HicA family toxin [Thermoanaerobacter wiegelii]AEM78268.1 YcfA family protein [Thermoanaerobacter wiegelii Rt8.B1]